MKMKIPVRRSCITLIVISALVEAIKANENETSSGEDRQGRVSGRIVKLYSGYKPDPVLCIEEGFKADPVHCSVFYRCLKSSSGKFTVFKFQCGPGTVYDPETEVCNHPSSTKRSECGGRISHVEKDNENENDIDQHELPSPISTIVPVYTSSVKKFIGYPASKVPSLSSSGVFIPSAENGYINSFTTSSTTYHIESTTKKVQDLNHNLVTYPWTEYKNMTQQKITSSTTILEKSQPCTSAGFMGDSEDCKKFYRCVSNSRGGFIRYEFLCSEPTVWDDNMQSCNHPWAVRTRRCGRVGINSENYAQISHLSTEQMNVSYGIKIPESQNQENSYTSQQREPPANYGDRLSNVEENNVEKNQIIYGSSLNDYPEIPNNDKNIKTQDNVPIDDINNNYNFGQKTTVQATYSTNKLSEHSVLQSEIGRNFVCTQSGFVGDSVDCKKFYRCVENGKKSFTKYEFTCSQGTVWDKKLEACNYAWAVKECGGTSASDSLIVVHSFPSSTSTSATVLSENVENGYINHSNQEHEPPTTIKVNTPIYLISTPAASNQIGAECTVTGFVGDKNDCQKFYRCVDNGRGSFNKFEYKCGDGTLWDQNIEACNHAWAVHSCNSTSSNSTMHTTSVTTAKTHTTAFLIQSTTPGIIQDNNDYSDAYGPQLDAVSPNSGIDLQKTTLTPVINQKNNCESTGFMGDTNDCTKFYRCIDNGQRGFIKYEFSCGEGTVWDPEIEACNHAWAVKQCGSSTSLNDDVTSSSIANIHSSTKTNDFAVTTGSPSIQTSTLQKEISDYDTGYGQQQSISTRRPDINLETTTLKQTHGQTNNCHASGFIGDINNCNKFYRCVDNGNGDFIRYEFSCGEGTVWDPEIEACNHAWAVKHCGSSSSLKDEVTSSSIANIHSSTKTNDFAVTTGIPSIQTSTLQKEISDYDTGYGQQQSISTRRPDINLETTTLKQTHGQTNNCHASGFIGDINNCNKFYRCVDNGNGDFIRYEFSCGEGTVWDPEIEACNHAWTVKHCGGSMPSKENHSTSSITNLNVVESNNEYVTQNYIDSNYSDNFGETITSTSSTVTLTTVTNTSTECESGGFMGDNSNCQKFYRCLDNGKGGFVKHEFMCGEGTVWDSKVEACNHKWAVEKCGGDLHNEFEESTTHSLHPATTSYPVTESATSTLSVINSTSTMSTTSTPSVNLPSHEDRGCSSEGYFANSNDCKKFYRCVNNGQDGFTKYEFSCAEGTAWDKKTQSCNYISEVEACHSNEHQINMTETKPMHDEPITESDTTKTTTSVSTTTTPASETSASATSKSTTSVSTTSASATSASTKSTSTTSALPSTTVNTKPVGQNACKEEGYFGDINDCKKFYRCVYENNGVLTKYDFACGDGTIWDQDIITCNHPHDVKNRSCKSVPESTSPVSTSSTTIDYSETSSTTTTNKPTSTSSISEVSSNKNETNSNCNNSTTENSISANLTCSKAGYYADPNNCKKFYRCVDWENNGKKFSIYNFECADGTIWDPALETCNHEDSVYPPRNCNGTHQQNENTTATSSTTEKIETTTNQAESTTSSSESTTTSTQSATTSKYPSTQTTQSATTEKPISQTSTTQSSTTEESTTHSSATQSSTTQSSTTQSSTTQSSTTQSSTTQSSTTEESTTHSSPPEESTTQSSTTQSSTTEESTTHSSTTQSSTTEESTTHSSTPEESTTQTSTTHSSTPEESTTYSSTTQSSTTEESTTHSSPPEESTTQSSTTQSSTTEESTSQTTTTQSSTPEESTTHSSTTEESTTQSSTTQSSTPEESTTQTTTQSSTTEESTTQTSTTQSTTTEEPTTQSSTTKEESTTSTTNEQSTSQQVSTTTETDKEQTTTTTQMTTSATDQTSTTTAPSATTMESSSSSTTENNQESTTETSTNEKCPDTADDQYLYVCPTSFKRHPKYCNLFYQCTEDNDSHELKIAVFNCPNNTIYDESKIQCVEKTKSSKKCNGQISQKYRVKRLGVTQTDLFVVTKENMACQSSGHFPFEKHTQCSSSFLKCELTKSGHLRGYVNRCPDNFVYWNISRRCEPIKKVRDCKRSSYPWERRYDIPLERFNIAL